MPDGTKAMIAAGDEFDYLPNGGIRMYPQGDRTAPPSIYMPDGGYFFDIIDRAPEYDEDNLTPREDFKNFFSVMSDETAKYYEKESKRLFEETPYAIIGNLAGAGFGDPGAVPAPFEKYPKGIRKFDDWCMKNPVVLIIVALLIGVACGYVNGLLLTKLHLPHPFVSTLGMKNVTLGLALIVTASTPIGFQNQGVDPVLWLGSKTIGGFPVSFIFVIIAFIIMHIFLTRSVLGRQIYCVGGNPEAARLSGINSGRVLRIVYTLSGFLTGIAAIILVGRVSSANANAGTTYDTDAIAACIIGGASFMTALINAMRVLTDPAETGAVCIALSQDVEGESYDYPDYFFQKRVHRITRPVAVPEEIEDVANVIAKSKNPLVIVGGGVKYSEAGETLEQFCADFNIPFGESQSGKSACKSSNPYCLGGIGVTGTLASNMKWDNNKAS